MQDNQGKETSTYEVQSRREYKKIPPEAWMFVMCVLYSKDKRQKPELAEQRRPDEVQRKNKKKNSRQR